MSKTRIYDLWVTMHQRCKNPKATGYELYGARGIDVCKEWESFEAFFADMGEKPAGKSLDRINGTLGYSKENCRWSTAEEQLSNRRKYEKSAKNTVGVFGVYWKKSHNKFVARATINGRRIYIGFFKEIEDATAAMEKFQVSQSHLNLQ